MQQNAESVITFTLYLSVAFLLFDSIVCFALGIVAAGVILLIFAIINAIWAYWVRSRIPFSAAILQTSVEVIRKYPNMVSVAVAGMFVQAIWFVIWAVAASSILRSMDGSNTSSSTQGVVSFVLLLSFYCTAQVIKNIVHVTVSGAFATWYFMAPHAMPANPTSAALKRASWLSLGSIALGSLIVALIQTVKHMLEQGRRSQNEFARSCVVCLLGCMESLVAYFNHYAYAHVAIYGRPYCESAKSAWSLIKARGFDLLINDNLIDGVLSLGALIVGAICAGLGLLLAKVVFNVQFWGVWGIVGLLIGLAMALCAMEVVQSCVACLFVCFAEDPAALANTKPDEYNRINDAFTGRLAVLGAVRS